MKHRLAWPAVVLVAGSAACGGAAEPPAAAPASEAAPSNAGTPSVQVQGGDNRGETPATAGTHPVAPEIAGARGELDRAERQVAASQGDCAAACRALASMERAADHLCALAAGSECSSARERVEVARQRVQSTCGACAR